MLGEELGNLGFHSLGQKGARPATQDFGELVGEHPWLNELDDGIFGHGVPSFGGEVAGLITATIRRLHSFTPSPTSAHSSWTTNSTSSSRKSATYPAGSRCCS